MRNNTRFSKIEVSIVAAVLTVLGVAVIPQFSQANTDDRLNTLCGNLQLVRSQLSLYRVQHEEQWPRQATFADQLTKRTNVKGSTDLADGVLVFGPYLKSIPANPFTGGNAVNGGDWTYDEATGKFIAADGGQTKGVVHGNL
jgi:competence protein ComGC